jgi:hypothetical protein
MAAEKPVDIRDVIFQGAVRTAQQNHGAVLNGRGPTLEAMQVLITPELMNQMPSDIPPCILNPQDTNFDILNASRIKEVVEQENLQTYEPLSKIPAPGSEAAALINISVKAIIGAGKDNPCNTCKMSCFAEKRPKSIPKYSVEDEHKRRIWGDAATPTQRTQGNKSEQQLPPIYSRKNPGPKPNGAPRFDSDRGEGASLLINDDHTDSPPAQSIPNGNNGNGQVTPIKLQPREANGNSNGGTTKWSPEQKGNGTSVISTKNGNYPEFTKGMEATELIYGILDVVGKKYPLWMIQDIIGLFGKSGAKPNHRERWQQRVNEGLPHPIVATIKLGGLGIGSLVELGKIAGTLFKPDKPRVEGTPLITIVDTVGEADASYVQLVDKINNGDIAIINPITGEQEILAVNLPENGRLGTPRKESLLLSHVQSIFLNRMNKSIRNPEVALYTWLESIIKQASDHESNLFDPKRNIRPSRRFITSLLTDSTNCMEVELVDGIIDYEGVRKVGKKKLVRPREAFKVTADLSSMARTELDSIRKELPFDMELLALMLNAKNTLEATVGDHLQEGVVHQDFNTYAIFFKWEKIKREMGIDTDNTDGVRKFIEQSKQYKVNEEILTMLGQMDFVLTTAGLEFKNNLDRAFTKHNKYKEYVGIAGSEMSEDYINLIKALFENEENEEMSGMEMYDLMFACSDALATAIKCPQDQALDCYMNMFDSIDDSLRKIMQGKERDIARAVILTGLTEAFKDGSVEMGLLDLLFMVAMGADTKAFELFLNSDTGCKNCPIDPRYCPAVTGMMKVEERQVVELVVPEP